MRFTFKEGSIDSLMFDGIYKYDEYRLPDRFLEDDIIIDIGAHVGFFTYAAIQRGAKNIYAFEVDHENYSSAVEHLKDYVASQTVYISCVAVWRSDRVERSLYYSGKFMMNQLLNSGGGDVLGNERGQEVPAIPFDSIILRASENAQKRIRLVKLDCEGSEWPILLTSKTLYLIDEICGEFHEIGGEYDNYTLPHSLKDFDRFSVHTLITLLKNEGFDVTYERRKETDGSLSRYGMFFATRIEPDSVTGEIATLPLELDGPPIAAEIPVRRRWKVGQIMKEKQPWRRAFTDYSYWMMSLAFSPDGSKVLTGAYEPMARLWQAGSGQAHVTLKGHTDMVLSIAFSPDGSKVLTGSMDGTARLWDTESGQALGILKGHTGWVLTALFSPDGRKVLTGSMDGTARLWDTESGQMLVTLDGHTRWVVSVAFSPDGNRVLTGSYDQTGRLCETVSGRLLAVLEGHRDMVMGVAFSLDGRKMLTGSYDGTVKLWDGANGQLLTTLKGHKGVITSVSFSPDGSKILTSSDDGTACLWQTYSGQMLAVLNGHMDWIATAAFSPDGSKVITGSFDGTARLWDTVDGRLLAILKAHRGAVRSAAFSSDGRKIVTGSEDGAAIQWDID